MEIKTRLHSKASYKKNLLVSAVPYAMRRAVLEHTEDHGKFRASPRGAAATPRARRGRTRAAGGADPALVPHAKPKLVKNACT